MPNELAKTRRRLLQAGSVLVVIMLTVLGWGIWRAVKQRETAQHWVEHTRQVMEQLDAVHKDLQTAESSLRGYLVTDKVDYLEPYDGASKRVGRALEAVEELTRDNPNQQQRIARLRSISRGKLEVMDKTIKARREAGLEEARRVVLTGEGKQAMELFIVTLANMRAEEERLLAIRHSNDDAFALALNQVIVALALLIAALAGALFYLLRWISRLQLGLV